MGLFGRSKDRERGARLFFVTDIHGSERCFRKFLNAGAFYDVDYLILGGDITGKTLVPVERSARGWTVNFRDHRYADVDDDEVTAVEQQIRDVGQYPVRGERDELHALHDEARREDAFRVAVVESMERWASLAAERLAGTSIRCFVAPGNDDYFEIDEPLRRAEAIEFAENRCIRLDGRHEMITTGYSNITPWESPRELDEPDLAARIDAMYAEAENPENLVAVLHPPPRGTSLDQAPEIDAEFTIQLEAGVPKMTAVGSSAVRDFILARQPLLGLHGHVHESKGEEMLGRTLCVNPGSEYTEGTLCGALVSIGDGRVLTHQLVVG
jgi:Icc-related predicted phosphoesterase